MRNSDTLISSDMLISMVLAAFVAALPGTAAAQTKTAQLGGSLVTQVTVGTSVQIITDAISNAVSEVLNARPVIDREKVEGVNGVAVGAKADRMVTALSDGSVGLWDLNQGIEKTRLKGHSGPVKAVAVSENAGKIVSAGDDGAAQVWSLKSGKKLARFTSTGGAANGLALSFDGTFAATGHADGVVRQWDVSTGTEKRRFKTSGGAIGTVVLGTGDTIMAAGVADGTIWVWNVASGAKLASFKAHEGAVTGLTFITDGSRLASAGEDGRARVWNTASGAEITVMNAGTKATRTIAASHDGTRLASGGDDGIVRLFDVTTGQLVSTYEGHAGSISSVAFGKDDAVIHTASQDGTSRIFEREHGKELAQIVSSKEGWLVFNLDGDFDGEGDAIGALTWATDDQTFDLDQFAESHHEPGVLANAAAAIIPAKPTKPVLSVKFATPPIITIATPDEDTDSDEEEYEVEISAADLGGGIKEIRLYQNGKLIKTASENFDDKGETLDREFDVKLVPGKNEFRVVALSRDLIESRPAKVKVKYSGAERKSTLRLLTVGINKYRNPALNLNYGVPDADGIRAFFSKQPRRLFKDIKEYAVFDKGATKQGITQAVARLNESQPEDVVIVYLAGHGDTVDGKWYFLPYDVTYPEKEEEIRSKGISAEQINAWIEKIPAQKIIVLMDACKSGAALKKFRGFEDRKALSRLARTTGIHIVAAAGKAQFAVELKELGHGAFTYTLLEGLEGAADSRKDGTITVRELTNYIENRLPDLSEEKSGEAQFPVINSKGNDFPIAVGS